MAISYLPISAVCTLLSFVSLQYWTELSLEKITTYRLINEDSIEPGNARQALQTLLGSEATVLLLANFALNVFVLLMLGLKSIFFSELYPAETRKLGERIISYVIYKGIFLPLVGPPTIFQAVLWSTWLAVLCSLKMFQALGRDRLDRLNASPSATPWTCFRVYSSLLFVLLMDLLWIKLCAVVYRTLESSMFLLLFYEPLSIAFETLQAIVVHGFQLLDVCMNPSAGSMSTYTRSKLFDMSAGSLWEWKGMLTRNLGFFLDIMTLLMALGHYVHIWWLHGTAFHLLDVVLFLNIRALLSAIMKRTKGFVRLRKALGVLQGALPDATSDEIQAYDDECAICREPMAKAKRLSCNHLFHLACLRSWLDQGMGGNYACPTCRKPLQMGRPEDEAIPRAVNVSADEQLARQLSSGLDRHILPAQNLPRGGFSNDVQNLLGSGAWRGTGPDPSLLRTWSTNQALDGAGPSTGVRPVGLGRVQMMMRQLTAVGETHGRRTTFDDAPWSLWSINPSQAAASSLPLPTAAGPVRYPGRVGGLHMRSVSQPANDNLAHLLSMAETVREVLPHVPDEVILQDLQRTNSVSVTVNNLLQM